MGDQWPALARGPWDPLGSHCFCSVQRTPGRSEPASLLALLAGNPSWTLPDGRCRGSHGMYHILGLPLRGHPLLRSQDAAAPSEAWACAIALSRGARGYSPRPQAGARNMTCLCAWILLPTSSARRGGSFLARQCIRAIRSPRLCSARGEDSRHLPSLVYGACGRGDGRQTSLASGRRVLVCDESENTRVTRRLAPRWPAL